MSNTTSPALPPFSYAQAARGLTPSNQTAPKSPEPSITPAEQNPRDTKPASIEPGKLDLASPVANSKLEKSRHSSGGSEVAVDHQQTALDNIAVKKETLITPNRPGTPTEDRKTTMSLSPSQSTAVETPAQLLNAESPSLQQNEASESWEKQSQDSTYVEKSTQTSEKMKGKESEDDWEKISASAFPVEKELRPAPIPTVNFWHQRKAEHAAKAKDPVTQPRITVPTPNVAISKTKTQGAGVVEEGKRKQTDRTSPAFEKDGSSARRKQESGRPNEGGRRDQAAISASRPGSQHKDNAEPSVPPPVGDAESWPTPDTALSEERRKSVTFEKPEKLENKANGLKSHTKQWTPIPYVPTVVFETQLPPAAARRGGRPGNRGREGNGRGASNANNAASTEKIDLANSMPPPPVPLPRQPHEQERGRRADAGRGGRASSVPTQGKRSASATGMTSDTRKVSETPGKDRGGFLQTKAVVGEPPMANAASGESMTTSAQDHRAVSRPLNNTAAVASHVNTGAGKSTDLTHDTHAHPDPENDLRQTPPDWHRNANYQNQRSVPDYARENASLKGRGKEAEGTRAKVQSWRDRDPQADQTGHREPRAERGRGSHRGRGTHSSYATQSSVNQSYTAPLPQQQFSGSKSNSFHDGRHRQSSQGYVLQSTTGTRGNPRSQSIPNNTMYQPFPNGMVGMNQPLSPIQTDMSMYGYGPMHPGVMSAMPYNSPLESYALISMVSVQVEYYFSIDNLCKDMFLRRNMDSQGWVPISVIANFKRIRSLTEDMSLLRSVCAQLKGVEFLPGENGEEDRLRSREKWNEFILDAKDRLPEARNDGPSHQAQTAPKSASNGYSKFTDSYFTAGQVRSPTWTQNFSSSTAPMMSPPSQPILGQFDGMISETPLSATVPDYSPGDSVLLSNVVAPISSRDPANQASIQGLNGFGATNLTNGYHSQTNIFQDENEDVFPNESITDLRVVSRTFDIVATASPPPFISHSTRTFSHGSIDEGTDIRGAEISTSATLSGLRGGAGSPEHLEQLQMPQSALLSKASQVDAPPILWVKDGVPPVGLHQEGMTHELYLSLRDRALQQRLQSPSPEAMGVLYQFWSHFLVRNFNVGMYEEFHTLALNDLQNGLDTGSKHLVRYYEALLTGRAPLSDRLVHDIVAMAGNEPVESRLAFQKLRSAWRNGAFNLKSRNKISKILTPSLRAELEK